MAVTKDKLASLLVFSAVIIVALSLFSAWSVTSLSLLPVVFISLLGLTLIWFAEPLGEIGCFSRGVSLPSPPALIEVFGWLFLVGYPLLLICVMRGTSV